MSGSGELLLSLSHSFQDEDALGTSCRHGNLANKIDAVLTKQSTKDFYKVNVSPVTRLTSPVVEVLIHTDDFLIAADSIENVSSKVG